ncbi:MAG: ferric reductase-like transmembrane domain-containing protein [Candidatus Gottesmanbacteria bacterium]|nr:ferric reductase-like transmembrane domain-containing protein [Candidatus Gottesmanbacteria bacterium]
MVRDLQEKFFQIAAKEKRIIYRLFYLAYIIIFWVFVWGSLEIIRQTPNASFAYNLGVWSGRAAVTMLAVVLIPGILGRFGIQIKVTRVFTFYRRQLGITTFLLSFTHGMLVRIVARIALGWYPISRAPLFELFGSLALSLLFFLFITSNDWSVGRLGLWWKRLHRFVYVIVWLILFHTILQRVSVWSVMISAVAMLEVVSLIYSKY